VASFLSGNDTTIIMHSFSFFVGLIIGLLGMKLKLIYLIDEEYDYTKEKNIPALIRMKP
jgi:ABC-type amino acid transport system permease subunit